jgi:hypothetical protein
MKSKFIKKLLVLTIFIIGGIFAKLPVSAATIIDYGWIHNNDGSWSYSKDGQNLVKDEWRKDGEYWYYLNSNGIMATGWIKDNSGNNYYLNANGSMKTGWLNDNGTWYYLNSNGTMAKSTTIDGYELNSKGTWISKAVNNEAKTTNENFEFDKTTGTIKEYKGTDTNVIIPNEINGVKVTSIGSFSFDGFKDITSITIPNSVTNIGSFAFWKCEKLANINIPDGVKIIEGGAFAECKNLTSVTIPNNVTSIGSTAFYGCSRLTNITIGDSVTNIDAWAFKNIGKDSVYYIKSEKIKKLLINSGSDIVRTEIKS